MCCGRIHQNFLGFDVPEGIPASENHYFGEKEDEV